MVYIILATGMLVVSVLLWKAERQEKQIKQCRGMIQMGQDYLRLHLTKAKQHLHDNEYSEAEICIDDALGVASNLDII